MRSRTNSQIGLFLTRLLGSLWGTTGKRRLSILIYHRVLPSEDYMRPGDPTALEFDRQMGLLRHYFVPLSMDESFRLLLEDRLPDRAVCVTFDDGYADNESIALPILKKWDIPATVFVTSGFLDGGRMWNDTIIEVLRRVPEGEFACGIENIGRLTLDTRSSRCQAAQSIIKHLKYRHPEERINLADRLAGEIEGLPNDLMLTTMALKNLKEQGITIGAHTRTHPILAMLDDASAFSEIERGKYEIEERIGVPLRFFAYPNGKKNIDYQPQHVEMVRSLGFKGAVTTEWGVSSKETDLWQLPRFTPWDKDNMRFLVRLVANYRKLV